MKPTAAISIDVDSLSSIYKGKGCTNPDGYTYAEFRQGMDTIFNFFYSFNIRVTLFLVGTDLLHEENRPFVKVAHQAGHELANHSYNHPQGFRWLSPKEKETQITKMGDLCEEITGVRPVGFRSPGWNIDNGTIPILRKSGYIYDSSIFPTFLMPLMKFTHWASMYKQPKPERTTMGMWRYMFAPITPYKTTASSLGKKGEGGLVEFPVSVSPAARLPFFATLFLFTGTGFFHHLYKRLRKRNLPIHFQMHLSDFADYSMPELQNQMPLNEKGVYVPQALATPLKKKLGVFQEIIETIAADYDCITLRDWAEKTG